MKYFTTFAVFAASALVASVQATNNGTTIPLSTGGSTSTHTPVVSPTSTVVTLSTTYVYPAGPTGTGGGSPSGSAPSGPNNGTNPNGPSATKTPVGPSTTLPGGPAFTGAAVSNQAFSGVAAIGLAIAYFL